MRAKQALLCCGLLAGIVAVCAAQPISCGAVAPEVRDSVRAAGACDDGAGARQRPLTSPKAASGATSAGANKAPPRRSSAAAQKTTRGAPSAIPDVVGATIEEAESRLQGFTLERVERAAEAPAGRVIEQDPGASTTVEAGSRIRLVVSSGPPTIALPDVVDRSFDDANAALSAFSVFRRAIPGAAPAGQVMAQNPAAGSVVLPGSTVELQVSDGSLANAAVSAVAPTTPAVAAAPIQQSSFGDLRATAVAVGASLLLGIAIGALSMRQWLLRRTAPLDAGARLPLDAAAAGTSSGGTSSGKMVSEPMPPARFFARLDAGDVAVHFASVTDEPEPAEEYAGNRHG